MNRIVNLLAIAVTVFPLSTGQAMPLLGVTSPTTAGDFTLKISKIEMKKTPQSGDWGAGVTLYQESEKDNTDSWHGGEIHYTLTKWAPAQTASIPSVLSNRVFGSAPGA